MASKDNYYIYYVAKALEHSLEPLFKMMRLLSDDQEMWG